MIIRAKAGLKVHLGLPDSCNAGLKVISANRASTAHVIRPLTIMIYTQRNFKQLISRAPTLKNFIHTPRNSTTSSLMIHACYIDSVIIQLLLW